MDAISLNLRRQVPWDKGRLTGQKPPLKLNEVWAIRTRLQLTANARELAMFNLAIGSKLCVRSNRPRVVYATAVAALRLSAQNRAPSCNDPATLLSRPRSLPGRGRFFCSATGDGAMTTSVDLSCDRPAFSTTSP